MVVTRFGKVSILGTTVNSHNDAIVYLKALSDHCQIYPMAIISPENYCFINKMGDREDIEADLKKLGLTPRVFAGVFEV